MRPAKAFVKLAVGLCFKSFVVIVATDPVIVAFRCVVYPTTTTSSNALASSTILTFTIRSPFSETSLG